MDVKELNEIVDSVMAGITPKLTEQAKKIAEQAEELKTLKEAKKETEKEVSELADKKVKEIIREPFEVKDFNISKGVVKGEEEKFATGLRYLAAGMKEKALNYLGEGSTAIGGAAVTPAYMNDEIIADFGKYGLLPKLVSPIVLSQPTPTVYLAGLLTGATMTKTSEAAAISTSSPTYQQPTITMYKWARTIAVSNEAMQDASQLAQQFPALMGEAAAYALDLEWLNTSAIGLCQKVATANKIPISGVDATAAGAITWQQLIDEETGLSTTMKDGAVRIMHPNVLGAVRKIVDNENRPIFGTQFLPQNNTLVQVNNVGGFPVYTSDVMPDGTAADTVFSVLCNPSKITKWAIVKQFEIEAFKSGSDGDSVNAITQDMTIFRFIMRAGVLNFVPVDVNGNAKGLYGLKTAAS